MKQIVTVNGYRINDDAVAAEILALAKIKQRGVLTHVLPPTSSDERQHVLDETCWCSPKLVHKAVGERDQP